MTTLERLLRPAEARVDRLAMTVVRARIASVPWRPTDDAYPIYVGRVVERRAA